MKKLVVAIAVGMVCLGAMAQGRVTLSNTSRLVYLAEAGNPVVSAEIAAGLNLVANLWVGSSADSLVYSGIRATAWSTAAPGQFTPVTAALPAPFVGGSSATPSAYWYFQVRMTGNGVVEDQSVSQIFQAYASTSSFSANNLTTTGGTVLSTWAAGTVPLTGSALFGAIPVVVPEPASFALAGLGAAALLIFRRRN